jgi:hypothetical protein
MAHGHEDKSWPLGIPAHYGKVWLTLTILFVVSYCGPLFIAPEAGKMFGATIGKVVLMSTAFGIAIWKASLVVKEFMHLPVEKKFIWYIEGIVVAFMLLFFFAVSPDVMHHEGRNWENRAAAAAVERGLKEGAEMEAHGGHHGASHSEAPGGAHEAERAQGEPQGEGAARQAGAQPAQTPGTMQENNADRKEGEKREGN